MRNCREWQLFLEINAPNRRSDLSKLGIRALIGGTIASLFTAVIVGMLI